ncbi:hypothetical protein [Niastella sp. OAS944]|uniref:hypothetical protein n=1 Tax=Niastella sp. OAS944 TaxID=2664089 RepID=UPI0035C82822|nr:hypothetical protein [Chitinophagaceae bacterium OAS944]
MIENIISVKKLILLPFLVFGQFIVVAQKASKKAQQVITLNLLPAGPVHLPQLKGGGNAYGKDKKTTATESKVELSQDKQSLTITQVIETVTDDKSNTKTKSIIYTATSL